MELRPVESSVIDIGHAQQPQEPALEPAQLGREDHRRSPPYSERVTLHVLKQVDHSAGRRAATFAALGVQRQACDRLAIHSATELAFQQGLGQERQKINTEQCLDAAGLLEINRSNLEVRLHVREALLERRLTLVGQQQLQLRQQAVVGDQGKDPVTAGFRGQLHAVDVILQLKPSARLLHIPCLGIGATATVLTILLLGPLLDLRDNPTLDAPGLEDTLHCLRDLGCLVIARPWRRQLLA